MSHIGSMISYARSIFESTKLLFILIVISTILMNARFMNQPTPYSAMDEAYSFSNLSMAHHFSLGYNNFIASFQWMETLAYIGARDDNKRDDNKLIKRLTLITNLNPLHDSAYYVAAVIIPWAEQSSKLSNPLLLKAIKQFPNDWRWPYYMGFNAYWFDRDDSTAAHYLMKAAAFPDVHPIVKRLAVRMQSQSGQLDIALMFLDNQIKETSDHNLLKNLITQRTIVLTEKILQNIERYLEPLHKKPYHAKDLQQLLSMGYTIPKKLPDGGVINFTSTGEIMSSHSKNRFRVFVPPHKQKKDTL